MTDTTQNRTLTDNDVEAIVDAAEARIVSNFYKNLGLGFWDLVRKAIVIGLVALAVYGATGNFPKGH